METRKMRSAALRSSRDVLEEELARNPELRRRWERTALARAVALSVVDYRVQHGLSQRKLAELLGWRAAQVGRLEMGEHNPSVETLWHLSRTLGLRFALAVSPAGQPIPVRPRKTDVVQEATAADGSRLLVAAGTGPEAGAAAPDHSPAIRTAATPLSRIPSNVPAPPMEASGAPIRPTRSRLSRSAPTSVPRTPAT